MSNNMRAQITRRKCRVLKSDQLRPCASLERVIDYKLRFHQLINLTTGADSGSFVALYLGAHKKRGVLLNFCPFCGTDIGSHIKKHEQ